MDGELQDLLWLLTCAKKKPLRGTQSSKDIQEICEGVIRRVLPFSSQLFVTFQVPKSSLNESKTVT